MSREAFLREAQRIETVNRRLWWLLRLFVQGQLSDRCDNCVIPETYREIGADGLCTECRDLDRSSGSERRSAQSRPFNPAELDDILAAGVGAGTGSYDALIMISGGKDSAYLLDRVIRERPELRPLTLLVDTGFMSPVAVENVARLCEHFGQDHLTVRLDRGFTTEGFRFVLTHLERQTGYSIVDTLDGILIYDTARNFASQLNIPLILSGMSRIQANQIFDQDHYELAPGRIMQAFEELAQTPMPEIYSEQETERFWTPDKYSAGPPARLIMPMVVWDPDETQILDHVEQSGLLEPNRTRPLLTNNGLIPVIAIAETSTFGYTSFEVEFSRMIQEGRSERRYWRNLFEMAEYSARTGRSLSDSTLETLDALGLTKADIGLRA